MPSAPLGGALSEVQTSHFAVVALLQHAEADTPKTRTQGIQHVYIKPRTPQLNGKVERSRRTDQQEFYQLLSYKSDVDLEQRLAEGERFYNFGRPHGAFAGQTPYRSTSRTVTVMMATVPRDPSHHTPPVL